jgi:transcriptional regulator with XRE-family HTH domain/mannose-6-phosphate isomerase-like protein (cupin superfamily)
MYEQLLNQAHSGISNFPSSPNLELGLGIKQARLRMGLTQSELAQAAKIKPSALKTLENGYAKFTTMANLEAISEALKMSPQDVLLESREHFVGNFFVKKITSATIQSSPPKNQKDRKKKHREELWYKRKPSLYEKCQIDAASPPSKNDFSFLLVDIPAGQSLKNLILMNPIQVVGFIRHGSVNINYNGKSHSLYANQGFSLRGDKLHHYENIDKDNPARLCIAFSNQAIEQTIKTTSVKPQHDLSIGRAISAIRKIYSPSKDRSLSIAELSRLTGVDSQSLTYMEKTLKRSQVAYWDKVEVITQALKMPFPRFLELASGRDEGYFKIATAHDRALIDYQHYLGVRIKSALFPDTKNQLHIFEMYIEPKSGIRKSLWKRQDDAKFVIYVDDGELLVEVGKNRKVNLQQGDSVFFDGSLGYMLTNSGSKPTKLLMCSCPPIVF